MNHILQIQKRNIKTGFISNLIMFKENLSLILFKIYVFSMMIGEGLMFVILTITKTGKELKLLFQKKIKI